MKKIYSLFLLVLCIACKISSEKTETAVFFGQNTAQWITDGRLLPSNDSLFYLDQPAPLFRKEFESKKTIKSAKLFITAAGYYKVSINGANIQENILDPAWTDFSKRIYFSEFDLTSFVHQGKNCLGVELGNGFYNPLPLRKWGHRNLRKDLSVGKPVFIAKLLIEYNSGKSTEIVSDETWKYNYGPLLTNSVFLGVTYNAQKELKKWNTPDFNDKEWLTAEIGDDPGGELQKTFFPSVQISEKIKPVKISAQENGMFLVDMGVNFTGTYKIKLRGNSGDSVVFRFGERIYEDGKLNPMTSVIGQIKRKGVGGPGAPEIAWQTDTYIFGEDSVAWFSPEFTYHTFRYIEINGLSYQPKKEDITGLFFHSAIKNQNHFSSSSDLLNLIQEATERTFRANLVSVQSDCPAREKFGYGGDLNATAESFIYNFDMQRFYRKTIYDWIDAMNDSSFVDTAPFVGIKYCGISWESAFLITQYYLYLYYNDTEIVKELYERNKKWMEKAARIHPNGLVEKGLSDHESLEPVPVELTGTCHYLQCARIMKTFSSVMGDDEAEKEYEKLAQKLQNLVKEKFWDRPVREKINRQTLFSTLLYHQIIPEKDIKAAIDSLNMAVKNGPSGHFNTGIFGTKYMLEALSEYNSPQNVFEIVNSTTYPGWGHMIERGATTIWETWKESDNTYSNCHPMFGSVTEWFYRWLAGIQPIPEKPGFAEFILAPATPEKLDFMNCNYQSPLGQITSNWKKEPAGYWYEFEIPEGSKARIKLPVKAGQKVEIKTQKLNFNAKEISDLQTGQFVLTDGKYNITVSDAL